MMSHLGYTLLLVILISAATAITGERAVRERVCAAAYTLVSCTLVVFAGSWLMYWVHG